MGNAEEQPSACSGLNGETVGKKLAVFQFHRYAPSEKTSGAWGQSPQWSTQICRQRKS